jgi:hypothetical protein
MLCHDCGAIIAHNEGIETTRSEQIGPAGKTGARTKTYVVTLCPACAHKRDLWGRLATAIVVLLILGGIAALIVSIV